MSFLIYVILIMCHFECVAFWKMYDYVIPNLSLWICVIPNICHSEKCVIPHIYLRNICSLTKDSPQESQQKRLSFLFRGGAWSSLSHMSEYPKCLSKGIIHILRKHFIWHGKGDTLILLCFWRWILASDFSSKLFKNICGESWLKSSIFWHSAQLA